MTEAAKWIPLDKIRKWDRNPRKHPEENLALLRASIRRFGWTRPLLVGLWPGESVGMLVAGHGALEALRQLYEQDPESMPSGLEAGSPWKVPVRTVRFSSRQEAEAYGLADNWLAEHSKDDPELLDQLVRDLGSQGVPLADLGKDLAALQEALGGGGEAIDGEGEAEAVDPIYKVLVEFSTEGEQAKFLDELIGRGISCRALVM